MSSSNVERWVIEYLLNIFRLDNLIKFILEYLGNWLSMHVIPESVRVISETSARTSEIQERDDCNSYLRKEGEKGGAGQVDTSQFIINS